MTHFMNLNAEPFDKIASGQKTIELRLYDEKRKLVKPDDEIIFTHIQNPYRSISVIVDSVITAASFETLFKHISLIDCGYEEKDINGTNYLDMNQYYSEEQQRQYGVVGIKFSKNEKRKLSNVKVSLPEIESYLAKCAVEEKKTTEEVQEWYSWFESIQREDLFSYSYKKAIQEETLEASLYFIDEAIVSYIYNQTLELKLKLLEDAGYDLEENIEQFFYRYYDRPVVLDDFFPLKHWWDTTRDSMLMYYCGTAKIGSRCPYRTVFDDFDDDGNWIEYLN